jgi:hypothetical protein
MSTANFLRAPIQYLKAQQKARRQLQYEIKCLVASGVLRRITVLSRIG